ncbi:uncharacterized protein F5891DRAFT_1193840 [Suillus fuscotomentosus]|uniref:Uncharacterized protein n=1 Tax=Suillus fuscotomentosus TaxID=1912939 RepID=A0AAD4DXR1_9AGAM|nr:uncharacterized protein F5891DRAFT_1193840 [Suillus fuscotomentosus]KAG1895820.1 hypothetical protein F5891DRAFT_1193840 [Suillus fuscotomentosus]
MEFSSVEDDQGKVIEFTPQFTTGLTHSSMVFPCNISSHSRTHSELVNVFDGLWASYLAAWLRTTLGLEGKKHSGRK